MATFKSGPVGAEFLEDQFGPSGERLTIARPPAVDPQWLAPKPGFLEIEGLAWDDTAGGIFIRSPQPEQFPETFKGDRVDDWPLDDFFNNIIVLPLRIDAGFILSTLNFVFDVYNSWKVPRTFVSFTNNAGPGVTVTNLPALPTVIQEQDGFTLDLEILAEGPPINGTLVFEFDTQTITVPVTGIRSVVWPFEPEDPLTERLEFLTDIMPRRDKSEQRISVRGIPRQFVDMVHVLSARERQLMENLIFSNQALEFGVPVWWEQTLTSSPILATDATIDVGDTRFRDLRNGGQAIVWTDAFTFEALTILSFTDTKITFTSGFQDPFPIGAKVMPLRIGQMNRASRGNKRVLNVQRQSVTFTIVDSTQDLADASAFPTFDGKVLLDEPNLIRGVGSREQFSRDIIRVDSESGRFAFSSDEDVSRRTHAKGFLANSMERLWNVRQLMHAFRGRQRSFLIPSFFDDLTPVAGISSASQTLDFENIRYTLLVQDRQPRDIIQVLLTDGTTIERNIDSSTELSDDVEQLTVDASWGVTATLEEIKRVSFVEDVRLDRDEVRFIHRASEGAADVLAPIVSVLE